MKVEYEKMLTDEDPIFGRPLVINLDKDTKRWDDLCEHFSQWGIFPERFSALSGITLPALPPSMTEVSYRASLNLTHAAVSRHCLINSKRHMWLVMEDDCRFTEDPRAAVYNCIQTLSQKDWSIISLGAYSYDWQAVRSKIDYSMPILDQPKGWFPWGAHAYIVSKKHAYDLIKEWSACVYPPDHLLLHEYAAERGYLRRPSVAYQEEYVSYHAESAATVETKKSADMSAEMIELICQKGPT